MKSLKMLEMHKKFNLSCNEHCRGSNHFRIIRKVLYCWFAILLQQFLWCKQCPYPASTFLSIIYDLSCFEKVKCPKR